MSGTTKEETTTIVETLNERTLAITAATCASCTSEKDAPQAITDLLAAAANVAALAGIENTVEGFQSVFETADEMAKRTVPVVGMAVAEAINSLSEED